MTLSEAKQFILNLLNHTGSVSEIEAELSPVLNNFQELLTQPISNDGDQYLIHLICFNQLPELLFLYASKHPELILQLSARSELSCFDYALKLPNKTMVHAIAFRYPQMLTTRNSYKRNWLSIATANNYDEWDFIPEPILRQALESANAFDVSGYHPLHWAVTNGKNRLFERIVSLLGSDILTIPTDACPQMKSSAMIASEVGNFEIMRHIANAHSAPWQYDYCGKANMTNLPSSAVRFYAQHASLLIRSVKTTATIIKNLQNLAAKKKATEIMEVLKKDGLPPMDDASLCMLAKDILLNCGMDAFISFFPHCLNPELIFIEDANIFQMILDWKEEDEPHPQQSVYIEKIITYFNQHAPSMLSTSLFDSANKIMLLRVWENFPKLIQFTISELGWDKILKSTLKLNGRHLAIMLPAPFLEKVLLPILSPQQAKDLCDQPNFQFFNAFEMSIIEHDMLHLILLKPIMELNQLCTPTHLLFVLCQSAENEKRFLELLSQLPLYNLKISHHDFLRHIISVSDTDVRLNALEEHYKKSESAPRLSEILTLDHLADCIIQNKMNLLQAIIVIGFKRPLLGFAELLIEIVIDKIIYLLLQKTQAELSVFEDFSAIFALLQVTTAIDISDLQNQQKVLIRLRLRLAQNVTPDNVQFLYQKNHLGLMQLLVKDEEPILALSQLSLATVFVANEKNYNSVKDLSHAFAIILSLPYSLEQLLSVDEKTQTNFISLIVFIIYIDQLHGDDNDFIYAKLLKIITDAKEQNWPLYLSFLDPISDMEPFHALFTIFKPSDSSLLSLGRRELLASIPQLIIAITQGHPKMWAACSRTASANGALIAAKLDNAWFREVSRLKYGSERKISRLTAMTFDLSEEVLATAAEITINGYKKPIMLSGIKALKDNLVGYNGCPRPINLSHYSLITSLLMQTPAFYTQGLRERLLQDHTHLLVQKENARTTLQNKVPSLFALTAQAIAFADDNIRLQSLAFLLSIQFESAVTHAGTELLKSTTNLIKSKYPKQSKLSLDELHQDIDAEQNEQQTPGIAEKPHVQVLGQKHKRTEFAFELFLDPKKRNTATSAVIAVQEPKAVPEAAAFHKAPDPQDLPDLPEWHGHPLNDGNPTRLFD